MILKSTKDVSESCRCSVQNVRRWALENDVKKIGRDFVFTEKDIKRFNERKKLPGRTPLPKQPKGKRGRPRKEKPEVTATKRPRGRPRKTS